MPARDDYILRFIDLVGKALAQALRFRQEGKFDQALIAIVSAQEKLFARPTPEFVGLPLDEQLRLLSIGEAPESARAKCLAYASLLREAGLVYEARSRPEVAASAFQLALQTQLTIAVESGARDEKTASAIEDLLPRIPPELLQEPVKELLARYSDLEG